MITIDTTATEIVTGMTITEEETTIAITTAMTETTMIATMIWTGIAIDTGMGRPDTWNTIEKIGEAGASGAAKEGAIVHETDLGIVAVLAGAVTKTGDEKETDARLKMMSGNATENEVVVVVAAANVHERKRVKSARPNLKSLRRCFERRRDTSL